jgi:hypothetical protein
MAIAGRSVAIAVAVALIAVLTIGGTRAVFSGTTDNTGNSFASADIILYDDDTGTIMFDVAGLLPGDQVDHCVEVSYEGPNGRVTNGVNFYIPATWIDSATLADDLLITVEDGSVGAFSPVGTVTDPTTYPHCSGFISSTIVIADEPLSTFATDYATGYGSWTPTGLGIGNPVDRSFRITVELASASTAKSESVTAVPFTWEVQAGS